MSYLNLWLTFIVSNIKVLVCEIIFLRAYHIIYDSPVHLFCRAEVYIMVLKIFSLASTNKPHSINFKDLWLRDSVTIKQFNFNEGRLFDENPPLFFFLNLDKLLLVLQLLLVIFIFRPSHYHSPFLTPLACGGCLIFWATLRWLLITSIRCSCGRLMLVCRARTFLFRTSRWFSLTAFRTSRLFFLFFLFFNDYSCGYILSLRALTRCIANSWFLFFLHCSCTLVNAAGCCFYAFLFFGRTVLGFLFWTWRFLSSLFLLTLGTRPLF